MVFGLFICFFRGWFGGLLCWFLDDIFFWYEVVEVCCDDECVGGVVLRFFGEEVVYCFFECFVDFLVGVV